MAEFLGKDVSWKQIWQLVSGIHFQTPCDLVAAKLGECADQLRDGLLSRTPATAIAKVIQEKATLLAFSASLERYLGLTSPVQASNLICSYLVHEYKGSAASLLNLLATDVQRQRLLVDIGRYHALERMVLLKVVRNCLELHTSKQHPYAAEYTAIVQQLQLPALLRSYIAQLAHLIREPVPTLQTHSVNDFSSGAGSGKLLAWAERRNHELCEVLQILLLVVEHGGIAAEQVSELFALFRQHSFGRQQPHLNANNAAHVDLVNKVIYAEVALFMRCCSEAARSAQFAGCLVKLLHQQMPAVSQHAEHGPVLLSWMLVQVQANGDAATTQEADEDGSGRQQQQRVRQYGTRATQLGVFEFLLTMCTHPMHKDGSAAARIVRRTVYAMLTELCNLFDADGSVAQHQRIYELVGELLRTPQLARDFCNREDGVRSLWNTAVENFPLDFGRLSGVAEAVASTGPAQQAYIRKQLENLPIYTELIQPNSSFHLKPAASVDGDNEYVLLSKYTPFAKIDFDIPAGTSVCVQDRPFGSTIHFRTTVNYFNVLHNEINELLAETLRYAATDLDAGRADRVSAGIKYLANAVRNVTDPLNGISSEMVHPTEMVFDILTKFKAVQQPPIELLAKCLEVCTNLVPLFDTEIVRRVVNLNVLPVVAEPQRSDWRTFCTGQGFESGLVGYYLINFEKNCGRYDFLQSYLEFLHVHARVATDSGQPNEIELPGLVFILREVLPHLHGWLFEREVDRQRIYASLFRYLLNVLQATEDGEAGGAARLLLRNICVDSLLNLDNGMVLLRFIAIGNDQLQTAMQSVSNWMVAAETGPNQLVQLAMTTLMQILRLRNRAAGQAATHPDQLSPLESIIYTQPKQRDALRIIPMVTSYMSNIFNRRLPLLACRLLRRFALEFQMSLLACLDMEPDQIRLTFLARLPDDLESDQLKMAVIEFVEACIQKQPGLTEAFFRVRNERRGFAVAAADKAPRPKDIGDGILTYMTQYLAAVAADPQQVASPLLGKILALFHALWKNNMQSLVQDLKDSGQLEFWTALCMPLFGAIEPAIPAYSQLFNMLGIELFRSTTAERMDKSLETVFRRLFEVENLQRWVDSILDLPADSAELSGTQQETPEWLCRLQSFKDFVVLALRRKAVPAKEWSQCTEIQAESLRYFADRCLQVLVERAECLQDQRPFIILAELYLMLLLAADGKYTESEAEDDALLQSITKLLCQTAISYREMHPRARESILSIALQAVVLLAKDMGRQPELAADFMRSVVEALCLELQFTETAIRGWRQSAAAVPSLTDSSGGLAGHQSFVLSLSLLKQISTSFEGHDQFASHWTGEIISNRILNRLLSCLNAALPVHRFRRIVAEMLDVLIHLAGQAACSTELLHSDIVNYLWMRLLPPKEMLLIFGTGGNVSQSIAADADLSQSSVFGGLSAANVTISAEQSRSTVNKATVGSSWQTNDWWPIYARGIQLVTVLLQQHRHVFLKDALLFVGVHEEYVVDAVLLAKHTMDAEAVGLIKTALLFVCELVQYEKQWRLEHAASMINLMRSVQSIMDHSVSLLYRPKILQRLLDKTGAISPTNRTGAGLPEVFGAGGGNNLVQPSDELITAINDLIEIVTICTRSLLAFSPKLLDMLVEPEFTPSQWQPLIEIQFGAPKLYVGSTAPQLSFGTVLSATSIFTKALNLQQYTFYETPINSLRIRSHNDSMDDDDEEEDRADHNRSAQQSTAAATAGGNHTSGEANKSATRSMFTKTLSMTSNTSSATASGSTPGNEILSHLDEAQCLRALEFVLTMLCSQSLLALKDVALSVRDKQLIKRELSSELAGFHEFVRKRIMCDARGPLHRKKRGVAHIRARTADLGSGFEAVKAAPMGGMTVGAGGSLASGAGGLTGRPSYRAATMREKVIRHQHQLTTSAVAAAGSGTPAGAAPGGSLKRASIDLSPIPTAETPSSSTAAGAKKSGLETVSGSSVLPSSTPIVPILSGVAGAGSAAGGNKRVTFPINPVQPDKTRLEPAEAQQRRRSEDTVDRPYDATVFVGNEDATVTGLSLVQLVEADYLHLLSLVFMHICQHD